MQFFREKYKFIIFSFGCELGANLLFIKVEQKKNNAIDKILLKVPQINNSNKNEHLLSVLSQELEADDTGWGLALSCGPLVTVDCGHVLL